MSTVPRRLRLVRPRRLRAQQGNAVHPQRHRGRALLSRRHHQHRRRGADRARRARRDVGCACVAAGQPRWSASRSPSVAGAARRRAVERPRRRDPCRPRRERGPGNAAPQLRGAAARRRSAARRPWASRARGFRSRRCSSPTTGCRKLIAGTAPASRDRADRGRSPRSAATCCCATRRSALPFGVLGRQPLRGDLCRLLRAAADDHSSCSLAGALAGLAGADRGARHPLPAHRGLLERLWLQCRRRRAAGRAASARDLPAGLFFGFLEAGALSMQREVGVPSSLVAVIQGLTMLFVLCGPRRGLAAQCLTAWTVRPRFPGRQPADRKPAAVRRAGRHPLRARRHLRGRHRGHDARRRVRRRDWQPF